MGRFSEIGLLEPVVEFPFNEGVKRISKVIVRSKVIESDGVDNSIMVTKTSDGNGVVECGATRIVFSGRNKGQG